MSGYTITGGESEGTDSASAVNRYRLSPVSSLLSRNPICRIAQLEVSPAAKDTVAEAEPAIEKRQGMVQPWCELMMIYSVPTHGV